MSADALVPVLSPLELPGREAPDVDVELVEPGAVAVTRELDLELHLVGLYRQVADSACGADSWASPRAVGPSVRELSGFQYFADLRAYRLLVHRLAPRRRTGRP